MVSTRYLQLSIAAAAMFVLVGCNDFEGQITVKQPLKFNETKNNTVDIGTHDAKLKMKSKTEVSLEVSKAGKNNNAKIKFIIPKHEQLPSYEGPFELTAAQTGQPYDVKGSVRTEVNDGPEMSAKESCYYYDWVYKCYYDNNGKKYCQQVQEQVRGERCIRYYDRQTIRDITFDLYIPDTRTNVSTFDGNDTYVSRIKTWEDYRCERFAYSCH